MKQLFLLSSVITVFCLTASAQIKKGSVLLGGQIFYSSSRINYSSFQPAQDVKYFNFNPSAGIALKQNAVVGVYINYARSNQDYNYIGGGYMNTEFSRYGFGVFYRQYKKLVKDLYLFGELGAGYLGSDQTDTQTPGNTKTRYTESGAGLYLTPGVSYRIYKKLYVELSVPSVVSTQYAVLETTAPSYNSKENKFSFNTNLNSSLLSNVGLGFRFVL